MGVWDIATLPPREQFGYWQEVIWRLRDVRIPRANLLGEEGRGAAPTRNAFFPSGASIGIFAVAAMREAFDIAYRFARTETRGGSRPVLEHQAVSDVLADAEARIEAVRLLFWRALDALMAQHPSAPELSLHAKVYGSDTAIEVINKLVQVVGVTAYDRKFPLVEYLTEALAYSGSSRAGTSVSAAASSRTCSSRTGTTRSPHPRWAERGRIGVPAPDDDDAEAGVLRFVILLGAAIALVVLVTALIWMVQRSRQGATQRARRGAAARRRVANAVERADLATGTISVHDRFGALGTGGLLHLTAEPQPGDLSMAVISPAPPFDLTAPGAADALQDWEAATIPRRRTLMIRGYLAHPLPRVRAEAVDLIAQWGGEDARAPRHLAVLLGDDAEAVRRKAAAMAWSGGVDAVVDALREDAEPDAAQRAHAELVAHAPAGREAPALR